MGLLLGPAERWFYWEDCSPPFPKHFFLAPSHNRNMSSPWILSLELSPPETFLLRLPVAHGVSVKRVGSFISLQIMLISHLLDLSTLLLLLKKILTDSPKLPYGVYFFLKTFLLSLNLDQLFHFHRPCRWLHLLLSEMIEGFPSFYLKLPTYLSPYFCSSLTFQRKLNLQGQYPHGFWIIAHLPALEHQDPHLWVASLGSSFYWNLSSPTCTRII